MNRFLQSCLALLTVGVLNAAAQISSSGHLIHRYSFTGDAADLVGSAHGQLLAGAVISNNAVALDGVSAYVNLPNNLCTGLSSLTFEAWLTDMGGNGWARFLDFGNSSGGEDAQGGGTSYMFVAWPAGGGGSLRGCYRLPGLAENYLDISPRPAQGVAHHFAWTQDGVSNIARMYVDGVLAGTYPNFTYKPSAIGPTVNDWLGRSQYNDPYFKGSIDEFRIYDFALPAEELERNYQLGPDASPLGPVRFLAQAQDLTTGEGQAFVFAPDVTGACPFSFQWYRNGIRLPGATNQNLTGAVALGDDGAAFRLWVTNTFTNTLFVAAGSNAYLHVTPDTVPPQLVAALSRGTNGVEVRFSEPVRADTATNLSNYVLTGPGGTVSLSNPILAGSGLVVTLDTAALPAGATCTLAVSGVRDRAAAGNLIAPGSQASFTVTPAPVRDIGTPAVSGTLQYTNGDTLILTASGAAIGGTSDQCSMTVVSVSGDFDQQVRLAGFFAPDQFGKAGLMARETLDPDSAFAAALASPGLMGCFLASRDATGASAAVTGQFPVNYPETWLRLCRTGNVFNAYAGYDGRSWTLLGSTALNLGNTLQVGLALASHSSGTAASVAFADAGATASPQVGPAANVSEPLGPSSRRTPLVFSEIMFKPASRPDERDLEFVEIFNTNPWFHDIGGHRLGGDIRYTFPPGTIIPGGGFVVVAAAPADLETVYGLSGVYGPYTNRLQTRGTIQLHDEADMLLLEVGYDHAAPWPTGTDGTGHSLVLARPSYGEADPRAWDRSDVTGGSPGSAETFRPSPLRDVMINEILSHTDPPDVDTIELYNHANAAVDISGCTLSDDPDSSKFVVPTNTVIPARGFICFTEAQLGFGLNAAGETVYFRNPAGSRVLDALKYDAHENGVSFGRSPDGGPEWYRLAAKTFGTNNAAPLRSSVILNEIMYHPISGDDDDQYVELFNRGAGAVSLAGWKFVEGITYTFPTNAVIAPGACLVVAANASRLLTNYPQLNATNLLGNFGGRLSRKGERLALAKPDSIVGTNSGGFPVTNYIDIVVDEVTYGTGGRWGQWSDGGGSSLELTDARCDGRLAPNWGDSDESAKAPWVNIETTGVLEFGANYGSDPIGYAQIGLADAGECLIDNVEVRPGTNGPNYVANPDFSAGLANWSLQGAFCRSGLQATQGYGGGPALQLRTGNRLFTLGNSAQCALTNTSLASGQTATLQFKARWLRGSRDIIFRLNGNWLEAAGRLTAPANAGTPGLRNSRAVANPPPAIAWVTHNPALPAAGEAVVVSARVSDPDGVATISLLYRVDPSTYQTMLSMRDDGLGGDAVAGDGIYSARLPAASAGTTFAFVVQATDALGTAARFPALLADNSPARECVVRIGDPEPTGAFGIYHLWLTQTNVTRWLALPKMSNEELDATLVYHGRVIYNASARYSGSPYHETLDGPAGTRACHYIWSMPKDDLFLGASAFNKIHWPGNDIQDDTIYANNNDSTLQREQAANTFLRGLGVPWVPRRYVIVYVNGVRRGQVMEDALRPSGSVPEAYYPDDTRGYLYKIQPWFEGTAFPDVTGYIPWQNKSWAIVAPYRSAGGAYKTARYRWHYEPRDVPESANDYTHVFTLLDAMNSYTDPNYARIVDGVVDVDQWLRVIAANHAAGNWDCFGIQNGQNVYGYVSPQRRWQMFMFDFNIVLGNRIAWGPGANLETTQETAWARMYGASGQPEFRRMYWRALKELANGPMQSGVCNPLLDAKYAAMTASGIAAANPQPIKDWIASARTSISSQVASHDTPSFTMQAGPVTTTSNLVSITGTAPLEVVSFLVNGRSGLVKWTSMTGWTLQAPAPAGTTTFTIAGLDRHGALVPGASNVITVVNTAVPEAPEGKLVFNEIMYQAATPEAEYVELFNGATNTPFDLGGWQINGLAYAFPTGTVILPQKFLTLARSRSACANAYGVSNVVADVFDGNLQSDGETLSLLRPGIDPDSPVVVDRVRYEPGPPWPAAASRPGTALQLVDPARDNSRAANWAAPTNSVITPPEWIYACASGTATSSRLYVYLDAASDLYVDDLSLVAGLVPELGPNLFANSGFENALTGTWTAAGDLAGSVRDTTIKRTGTASLHLIAAAPGSGANDSAFQDIAPALTNGQPYTLSFWYRPTVTTNGAKLIVRLSLSTTTTGVYAAVVPTPPPTLQVALRTPGTANSVRAVLPAFPPLWLNEVQPQNLTGPPDNFGEREPWLELYNASATTQSLAGLCLGTNYANPVQWTFPANATIAPGQFLVVWADGQPQQSAGAIQHTGFRLSGTTGSVVLSRYVSNAVQVVDYLNYSALPANYSYGDVPDGQPFYREPMFHVSPGATNNSALPPIKVFINEWMAENTGFITDPGTGKYEDWFELYNPSETPAELGGYYLSDALTNAFQYEIPTGYRVPAHGYLLVWADSTPSANSTNSPDLHVNFKLRKEGEAIGLFDADGTPIDYVEFGLQSANISEGRYPDGGSLLISMPTPSPRAANILPPASQPPTISGMTWVPAGTVWFSFATSPGHSYRVEYKDDLNAPAWVPLGSNSFATGQQMTVSDSSATSAQRFYRILLLD